MTQFGYAKFSLSGESLAEQIEHLTAANCHPIYADDTAAPAKGQSELHTLLAQLHEGDVVVVRKLDRLGRSVTDLIKSVDVIRQSGAHLVCQLDGFDTRTVQGAMIFSVIAALAGVERQRIRERTKKGLEAAKINGRFNGRPKIVSDQDISKALKLHEQGNMTHKDLAASLGVSESTWRRTRLKLEREAHPQAHKLWKRRPHRTSDVKEKL